MDDISQKLMSLMSDPEIMSKIQGLSGLLSKEEEQPPPKPEPKSEQSPDEPALSMDMVGAVMKIMPIISSLKEEDEATRLLKALRPFLGEERKKKLDEGVRLMRVMRLLPLIKGDTFKLLG